MLRSAEEHHSNRLLRSVADVETSTRQVRVEYLNALVKAVQVAAGISPTVKPSKFTDIFRHIIRCICHRRAGIRGASDTASHLRHDFEFVQLVITVARADRRDLGDATVIG